MKILLVCLGNICRSPMAEGLLRHKARERGLHIETDSAGTGRSHLGQPPDPRAQAEMRRHGIDISDLRARLFIDTDFKRFDLLLAMDRENLADMLRLCPDPQLARRAKLMLDYAPAARLRDVPDPWYGGSEGFREVYQLLDQATDALIDDARQHR
jgi:protein-tyrosine phosphatase